MTCAELRSLIIAAAGGKGGLCTASAGWAVRNHIVGCESCQAWALSADNPLGTKMADHDFARVDAMMQAAKAADPEIG